MRDIVSPPALFVHRTGEGPPLVLFHGGMGSWNHWVRNLDALAPHFTVHALDLPGYGESYTVPKSTPQAEYVDHVVAGMRTLLGEQPFRLAGFSFGAIVAAMTAARMGAQVTRLSLLGAGGFGTSVKLPMRPIPPESEGEAARRDVFRHNLHVLMIADPAKISEETIDLHAENFRRSRFDGRGFAAIDNVPMALERITCPVQIVYGDRDALVLDDLPRRIRVVRAIRPDARIDVLPGIGHWVQYEAPDAVNDLLAGFMRAPG